MSPLRHLQIDNNMSDPEVIRLTHLNLRALYGYFAIEALLDPSKTTLRISTGHATQNTPCYYRIHNEEAFFFTLIKVATGLTNQHIIDNHTGGDYTRWSKAYPWMLCYINMQYKHILGYTNLARLLLC